MGILKNVLEYLENSAKKFPDKTAFTDESGEITFKELLYKAKSLGTEIAKLNIRNSPVGVFVERSFETLIGFFGVLYSGNFYVPIDPKMPEQRIDIILNKTNPALIVYTTKTEKTAKTLNVDSISFNQKTQINEEQLSNIRRKALDTDPVYVIFTSGSTGTPKGIVVSHKCVIDFTEWMAEACEVTEEEVMGNQAPFYFDCSVKDIYLTLKLGATTHIIPKKLFMVPLKLVEFLDEKKVTALFWATSAFHLVASSGILAKKAPSHLKKVAPGGEAMLAKHLNVWKKALPYVKYTNLYGPTEITVDCSYYPIDREFEDYEAIPIGKACDNKEIILLDEKLNPVKQGEPGEICVRGTGVTFGYYNDPEKTKEAFIQNPLNNRYPEIIYRTGDIGIEQNDGNIVFQARRDGQIKHMGYRIETGEIERAVNSFEKLKAAACFFDKETDRIICAFEGDCESNEILGHIKAIIPKYMFPNIFIKLDNMPYNANGKIDRPSLERIYYEKNN